MTDQADSARDPRNAEFVRRFVTIRAVHSNEEIDLEMPADRPVAELMPDLLKALGWPTPEGSDSQAYRLSTESGDVLEAANTLDAAGVENSDVLWIGIVERERQITEGESRTVEGREAETLVVEAASAAAAEKRSRAEPLSPPISAFLRVDAPALVSERGFVFELGSPPILIGRKSRAASPDIDLSDLDTEIVSSRRHARILLQQESYVLEAFPTTNGTYLNGSELKAGEIRRLSSGDRVLFGVDGVELVFFREGEAIPASFFRGR